MYHHLFLSCFFINLLTWWCRLHRGHCAVQLLPCMFPLSFCRFIHRQASAGPSLGRGRAGLLCCGPAAVGLCLLRSSPSLLQRPKLPAAAGSELVIVLYHLAGPLWWPRGLLQWLAADSYDAVPLLICHPHLIILNILSSPSFSDCSHKIKKEHKVTFSTNNLVPQCSKSSKMLSLSFSSSISYTKT